MRLGGFAFTHRSRLEKPIRQCGDRLYLLRLSWPAYDGIAITLPQGKSARSGGVGPLIVIPCRAALRRILDGLKRGACPLACEASPKLESLLILTTATDRPRQKRYFAHQWEAATKAAGIANLHFHDLHGTAVTMLSEAGCTSQQIARITGHSLKHVSTILDRYLARTRSLAEQAIFRFETDPRTKFANQMQTGDPSARWITKNSDGNQ